MLVFRAFERRLEDLLDSTPAFRIQDGLRSIRGITRERLPHEITRRHRRCRLGSRKSLSIRLTTPCGGATIEKSWMTRQLTRASRSLAGAIALALALVSPVTCFAATLQMTEQHAHCAAMGHDRGSADSMKQDCCATLSPAFAGLAPTASNLVAPPSDAVSTMLLMPEPPLALPAFNADADASPPCSTPTYLLVSVFRL